MAMNVILGNIEVGILGKSVVFVFSGGHNSDFGDFVAKISPFSVTGTQVFDLYERKTIPFSSN